MAALLFSSVGKLAIYSVLLNYLLLIFFVLDVGVQMMHLLLATNRVVVVHLVVVRPQVQMNKIFQTYYQPHTRQSSTKPKMSFISYKTIPHYINFSSAGIIGCEEVHSISGKKSCTS